MKLGIVGLGRMGGNMTERLRKGGHEVETYARTAPDRTADSLVATLGTRAGMLVMPDDERESALARIRSYLATRPETSAGAFTLPMVTCVLRVRRL